LRWDIVSRSQTPHLMTELGRDIIATACLKHENGYQIKPVNVPMGKNPAPVMKVVDNDEIKFAVIRNVDSNGNEKFRVSFANYDDGQGGRLKQPKFEELKATQIEHPSVVLPAMQSEHDENGNVLVKKFVGQDDRTYERESVKPIRNPNTGHAVMENKTDDKGEAIRIKTDIPVTSKDAAEFSTLAAALKAGSEIADDYVRRNQLNTIPEYAIREEKREEVKRDATADKAKAGKDDDPYGIA